jgi:hypothetical protein
LLLEGWRLSRGARAGWFATRPPLSDCSMRRTARAIVLSLQTASCYNGSTGTRPNAKNRERKGFSKGSFRQASFPAGRSTTLGTCCGIKWVARSSKGESFDPFIDKRCARILSVILNDKFFKLHLLSETRGGARIKRPSDDGSSPGAVKSLRAAFFSRPAPSGSSSKLLEAFRYA